MAQPDSVVKRLLAAKVRLFIKIAVLILLFTSMGVGSAAATSDDDEALARRFFELREQLLDQRGTPAIVDQLLSLFKTGAHYEHPAFSVVMTLGEARAGMIAHLREGRDAKIRVNKIFRGTNFVVAETTLHYIVPDENGRTKIIDRNDVAIFEMVAGRIVRVAEY